MMSDLGRELFFRLGLVLVALAAAAAPLAAQSTTLRGSVVDEAGAPLEFATIRLLAPADSSLAAGAVTGADGRFAVGPVADGTYLLWVSRIGYQDYVEEIGVAGDVTVEPVVLTGDVTAMGEVAVSARRLVFDQQADRLVVRIGDRATLSGATALDVVGQSPGVVVNEQAGTVSMLGKSGVRILVDGRESYMPPEAVVQYLQGLSADAIESVELITAPPAELDAEGNAGFINIVLNGQQGDGVKGSVSLSGGYGEGEVGSANADVQVRRGRLSLVGGYGFSWNGQGQSWDEFRRFTRADGVVESPTASVRDPVQRNHNARLRLDVDLSDRTTVGGQIAGYDTRWSMDAFNVAQVFVGGQATTRTESANEEVNHWQHLMANVNLRHAFAAGGSASVDFDVLGYRNENPTVYHNTETDLVAGTEAEGVFEGGKLTPLRIAVAKADYRSPALGAWTWSAGAKGAFSRFTNDPTFAGFIDPALLGNEAIGMESSLREDILAGYASARFTPSDATQLDLGLRYEWTLSDLRTEAGDVLVDRKYGELFPSAALSHQVTVRVRLGASYVRRITRPTFNDMSPFTLFLDPRTLYTGNASVQPATSHAVKADATVGDVLASVQVGWSDGEIATFQSRLLPEANVRVTFPTNLDATRSVSALVAAPLDVAPGWSAQTDATVTWRRVEGRIDDRAFERSQTSAILNSTHSLRLPAAFTLEVTGSYQSATLWGRARFAPRWSVNLALQRALPGDAGRLTLAVDDVFDSFEWRFTQEDPAVSLYSETVLDGLHRTVRLTYSRSFGTGGGVQARETASEEEAGRVQ